MIETKMWLNMVVDVATHAFARRMWRQHEPNDMNDCWLDGVGGVTDEVWFIIGGTKNWNRRVEQEQEHE